jgi:Retrotransposon gag protein
LATALRRSGRGGGGSNPPTGGGGGNGPPGGGGGGGGPPPQNIPQIPITPTADIRAMGTSPRIFEGDRRQARDFIEELQSYIRVNQGVAGFESPICKVALALTFIKGPEVARWTAAIGRWIDGLDQINDNVPAVWDQFLQELEDQFIDSTVRQRSRIELERLKMRFPEVDQYISKFEDLTSLAGYTIGNEETINFFLRGLPDDVMTDVLKPPFANTYDALKERAIAVTKSKQLISAIKGQHNNAFQNTFGQRQPYRPFFQHNNYQSQHQPQRTQFNSSNAPAHMNNQAVPMDMSARTRAPAN